MGESQVGDVMCRGMNIKHFIWVWLDITQYKVL